MTSVVHLGKTLDEPPVVMPVPGISVRHMQVPVDVEDWLALRVRAIAGLVPTPRPWMHADYAAEMYEKPWWRSDGTWLAIASEYEQLVGSVTLALREGKSGCVPVVHWLLVEPVWRRRGIARLLLGHLERAVWDRGLRQVQLETHAGWAAAVAFYQSIGFAPLHRKSVS